ncbi:hypothetical protein J31TS4_16040 [Paenibacillus sp. J31TS4]|uniref:hypothetical protein n=1 Tax=Paenibacillus sp. J31TS4 TaxID=2807195 RepID=UPI001B16D1DF|nr:hypothetical protein [Paenibacillus sp. J31TS4]GIP38324.1 hypothetical protein J31TS4_16040 [Paenibacillus sp. J31TS4]
MPIVKIGESAQVELGFGDVEIGWGFLDEEKVIGTVCFKQRETANEIGTVTTYGSDNRWEIEETPVRITFARVESIDALMRSLEDAKELMLARQPVNTD